MLPRADIHLPPRPGFMDTQGRQGTWNRRRVRGCAPQAASRSSGRLRGRIPAPQGRRRQAPQDRRRLTFFEGGAEIRRSRLWSLKATGAGCTSVHAAQYKTRPSQAEHVAERAGPVEARGASQLLGNCMAPGAGTAGPIAELQEAGGGQNVLIAVLSWLAIWNSRVLTPRAWSMGISGEMDMRVHWGGGGEAAQAAPVIDHI
jgi:hypothetical protein